jgi:hypothetical protein
VKKKSKFVAFILSFLPGLSHLYVGYKERAIIFFVLFMGAIFSVTGLSAIANDSNYFLLLLLIYPLLWFISMVDAVSLTDRYFGEQGGNGEEGLFNGINHPDDPSWFNLSNKKLITVVLSMVPGAGHMYLGLQNRGLALMTLFFFSAFLMGWLRMSVFIFVLPVIWFYSLFDAYHRVENSPWPKENGSGFEDREFPLFSWFSEHPQWTGWALIILGCLVAFERIISPLLTWEVKNYLQTGIVALILIGGGIKLLLGSRQNESEIGKSSAGIESNENGDLKEE